MIESIGIKNYKSIVDLQFDVGRVNVFIGENGSGKSNILEAIALAAAAEADKLDHEFLSSRGIRVTAPISMRSTFNQTPEEPIDISIKFDTKLNTYQLKNDNQPYSKWKYERE
ncbi:MAG: AAA family ATPase, partial [Cyanothece sp. SIO2G6]|nr:AAA family ATPase [Cyanothece sp. SIO2G6]